MCGIAGFWDVRGGLSEPAAVLRAMTGTMAHRGPDAAGEFLDREAGLGLGHRRLAILDLTEDGAQPMASASGRWVIAYNGEVYNFPALRSELAGEGAVFRGRSDTEVLLAAVEAWGLAATLERCNGMFAFALWDRRERRLHLVRDRLGIKPLYYGWAEGVFVFASEPVALRRVPGGAQSVDRDALALMLRHSYVPAPYAIWEDMRKLAPGCRLELTAPRPGQWPAPTPWWRARDVLARGHDDPFPGTPAEAVDELERLLTDAVTARMVADVPLGAFLSGGIDSSTVVALMQAGRTDRVRTFSIGFADEQFDEAPYAREVARHLGTDHTELYVTGDDCLGVVSALPTMFSEPFADPSQIPTFLVSRLARGDVTVSLSGDGGDELFAGYNRYLVGAGLWDQVAARPRWMTDTAARVLTAVPARAWDAVLGLLRPALPRRMRFATPGDKLHKLAGVLDADDFHALYLNLVSHWKEPAAVVPGAREPATFLTGLDDPPPRTDVTERMMYWDLMTYLPDDIMTKLDRASMAVGLESRVPLLDHRVVELAWRLPLDLKLRDGRSKWVLRRVLDRYVPAELLDRPKKGFGVPMAAWLRGPLREWAEDLLDESRLRREGFLDPALLRHRWQEHLSGRRQWQAHLWDVLMFQSWLAAQEAAP